MTIDQAEINKSFGAKSATFYNSGTHFYMQLDFSSQPGVAKESLETRLKVALQLFSFTVSFYTF